MIEHSPQSDWALEVAAPDGLRRRVSLTQFPFLMGRGGAGENHLQLADGRISRRCAAVVRDGEGCRLQDRGNRHGLFVNGERVTEKLLEDGDRISFGVESGWEIVFRTAGTQTNVAELLTRIGDISDRGVTGSQSGLSRLKLLLEATSLLHSELPLDAVLSTMLDHAIRITQADRGLLLEPEDGGALRVRVARSSGGESPQPETLKPSQTAVNQAVSRRASVITGDLNLAGVDLKDAESVVVQSLRAVVAIPLYGRAQEELLGVIYLDSRRIAAFSALDRQILDALGTEAASILDNARLVARERERQRLEQELTIARQIQQALLPRGLKDFPHLAVTGIQLPCHEVGGDYFDVFPVGDGRVAFLIGDVSGKGLGAALLTTMLQGALSGMTMGGDAVKMFNHINRFLCQHAEVGRYATIFFGLLDEDGEFEYIRAGHPPPLLVRGGQVSELYVEGSFPVGLVPGADYAAARMRLEPEDTLVLYSDGVTEAEDTQRNLFETTRLSRVLQGSAGMSIDAIQRAVLEAVRNFTRGVSQNDDLTLLVVRYRRAEPIGAVRG